MNDIKQLFEKVKILHFKYEQVLKIHRHDFNIFAVLHKEDDEVNLHSRFLFELLNPGGAHHQQDSFLALFLQQLEITPEEFSPEHSLARREYNNIDILITNRSQALIIENKIYAGDQPRQLERYYESLKAQGFEQILIVYLTPRGDEPGDDSLGKLAGEIVKTASYANDVVDWLSACIQAAALNPPLRETLLQYQNLIKKMTGQAIDQGYMMEIKELLREDDNFRLGLDIGKAVFEVMIDTQLKFWELLEAALKNKGYQIASIQKYNHKRVENFFLGGRNRRFFGLMLDLAKLNRNDQLYFYIEVDSEIYYGFHVRSDGNNEVAQATRFDGLAKLVGELHPDFKRNNWWLGWKFPNRRVDFGNFWDTGNDVTLSLVKEEGRVAYVKELAEEIDLYIKQFMHKVEALPR